MIVGVANVAPGVSTGTFMVLLGVYDRLVEAVSSISPRLSKMKTHLAFLVLLGGGAVVGTLLFAKLATFALEHYPVPAQFLFIGLIAGGIPSVLKMHQDMKPSAGRLIAFVAGLALAVLVGLGAKNEVLNRFAANVSSVQGVVYFGLVGFFAGGAVMTPGVSGSYIFLLSGTYEPIMQALSSLTEPPIDWGVIISVAAGVAIGALICTKLIRLALRRQPATTFYTILGLICGSFVGIWPAGVAATGVLFPGAPALAAGLAIAYLLGKSGKEAPRETADAPGARRDEPEPAVQ
jgi:putative membrane protein